MKSLVTLVAVTHTHTHTHTQVLLKDEITIKSNSFSMSVNKGNLKYEQK